MRANEFIIEDFTNEFNLIFNRGFNQYLLENSLIIESTVEGDEIQTFIVNYQLDPIISNAYFYVTLGWSGITGHKFLSIADIKDDHILISVDSNGQIIVKNTVSGQLRRFPELVGPVTDNTQRTILFNTEQEKNNFLVLLNLRFSDWRLMKEVK
jgi:hypothetical protein